MASSLLSKSSLSVSCRRQCPAQLRPAPFAAPSVSSVQLREVVVRAVEAPTAEAPTLKPTPSYVTTSDKYAIIDVGGVQHLVEEGRWYTCNRLKAAPGDVVSFGRVLAMKSDGKFHVGRPYVEGVTVEAEIVEELKGPKVIVYKMVPKKHTRKSNGHRQYLTKFMVTKIKENS